MKRIALVALAFALVVGISAGCKKQDMVTVAQGEVVLCTEGEIVSDTTEETEVPADEVANYSVTTRIETCDMHKRLADLYAQAQAAIASGDLKAATALLEELVELDPTWGNAGEQLANLQSGELPAASGGSGGSGGGGTNPGGSTDPGDDVDPQGPVMNLARYVPDTLSGFVAQRIIADPFVLTRDYLPSKKGAVVHLVIVAEQFKNAESASEELDSVIKSTYSENSESFKISGKQAYFGTRADVAIVAFIDGGILVAAEGATSSGGGSKIESEIKAVAQEIGK